jgi:hypothetical protein
LAENKGLFVEMSMKLPVCPNKKPGPNATDRATARPQKSNAARIVSRAALLFVSRF